MSAGTVCPLDGPPASLRLLLLLLLSSFKLLSESVRPMQALGAGAAAAMAPRAGADAWPSCAHCTSTPACSSGRDFRELLVVLTMPVVVVWFSFGGLRAGGAGGGGGYGG
eukprot:366372-Chlamydomonas_euryale.AAC.18